MRKVKKIFCTLGPSTLNKKFLQFSNKKVSLYRLNISHIEINKLKSTIGFIRKFSKIPICIDTEGAQIRTKVKKSKKYKRNEKINIYESKGNFKIYPPEVYKKIKKNDILNIGFDGLEAKVTKINTKKINCKVLKDGLLKNNIGVHLMNRNIKINFVTKKDKKAIDIAKKMKIKHYALSFTNSREDVLKFDQLLNNDIKIFKIETKNAITNLHTIMSAGKKFLIDRGDLSKDATAEMIPAIQRKVFRIAKRKKKEIYVATNFLESMLINKYPTIGEANDIYNTLEMGADGLVLAAETAIGKYPRECVMFLRRVIKTFNKYK